jgi:hypothetical protein
LQTSIIGDFIGVARIFRNFNQEGEPNLKLVASLDVGSSVRCIHYHSYVESLVLIGSMEGNLIGLKLPDLNKLETIKECTVMHTVKASITNIMTAPVKNEPNIYFIVLSDNIGYLHILKGEKDNIRSYKLLISLRTGQSEIWSMCINPYIDVLPET